jgi:hypothetical protein
VLIGEHDELGPVPGTQFGHRPVSADAGFSAIPNVRHVIPGADGIRNLLEPNED